MYKFIALLYKTIMLKEKKFISLPFQVFLNLPYKQCALMCCGTIYIFTPYLRQHIEQLSANSQMSSFKSFLSLWCGMCIVLKLCLKQAHKRISQDFPLRHKVYG